MPLPTLADLKTHLNITGTRDDDELAGMLAAAIEVVEGIVGPLSVRSVTETHYGVNGPVLILRQRPVGPVTAVATRGAWGPYTPGVLADYTLDEAAGLLRSTAGYRFAGDVTVTYPVGHAVVPYSVGLAVLIIAAHLWETQRGTSPSALALQQADTDVPFTPGQSYAIPNRASELLAPYARQSQIG